MVSSLVDISVRSILFGIRDGTIQHPHLLPPKLRVRVLDTAIKQGFTKYPNFLALASVEFLNGMTSLTAEACTEGGLIFVERLTESLATKLPNGETVGANIKELNLEVRGSKHVNEDARPDFSTTFDLIAQCPNTTALDLRVTESSSLRGIWPLKDLNSSFRRVMENLTKLTLSNWNWVTVLDRPIVNFRQLTTLILNQCVIGADQLAEILNNIQSVENLHFFTIYDSSWQIRGLDWILPFPLPHLKSFHVVGDQLFFNCNKAFVDRLMKCPELRQVHLQLDDKSTDEESLVRLATMNIALKMKIRINVSGKHPDENASVLDSSSRFKIVTIFRERIDSFDLCVRDEWDPQYSTALQDMFNTCSNLTTFGMRQPRFDVSQPQRQRANIEERNRINVSLIQFFDDLERAQQLNRLRLIGNFDEPVLSTIFDSCVNLTRLEIIKCDLRDQHLINWVSVGGGNLTDLVVIDCNNVTIEGIIPILAKSAQGLLRCSCSGLRQDNGGRNLETELRNHCPNARFDEKLPVMAFFPY